MVFIAGMTVLVGIVLYMLVVTIADEVRDGIAAARAQKARLRWMNDRIRENANALREANVHL